MEGRTIPLSRGVGEWISEETFFSRRPSASSSRCDGAGSKTTGGTGTQGRAGAQARRGPGLLRVRPPVDAVEEPAGVIISYGDDGEPVSVEFLDAAERGLTSANQVSVTVETAAQQLAPSWRRGELRRGSRPASSRPCIPCTLQDDFLAPFRAQPEDYFLPPVGAQRVHRATVGCGHRTDPFFIRTRDGALLG